MKVVLADYGAGNTRSVCAALSRAGAEPVVSTAPDEVREAPLVVIAGVGHVASAARGLIPLEEALRGRADAGRPILGICVGLQLLFEENEEGGRGLGLLGGPVRRLRARRIPHMGWNAIRPVRESRLLDGLDDADVYFAHSYAAQPDDSRVTVATVDHGGPIVAAVESAHLAGVQFHPERSGSVGGRILENLVQWSRSG